MVRVLTNLDVDGCGELVASMMHLHEEWGV